MLNFCIAADGTCLGVSESLPKDWADRRWLNRNDLKSFEQAEAIAAAASRNDSGRVFIATDSPNAYPRFDVVEVPKVGDEVSMGFNGDYYPRGVVTKVSPDHRIVTTSDGQRFFRRRKTGVWLYRRMWALVSGHTRKWNPEF